MSAMPDIDSDSGNAAPQARADEALMYRVFEQLGEGEALFDAELHLTAWNAQFLALTGLVPAAVWPGVPLRELIVARLRAGEYGAVGDEKTEVDRRVAMLRRDAVTVQERLRANGRTIEIRRSPTPDGGVVVVVSDITQRKAIEASLAERQSTLDLLLERTEQGFWFIDNELVTTDANPAMCRLLGLTREQMLGRDIYQFVDEDNAAIFRHHVSLRTRGLATGYEIALLHADGHAVHCFNNATPMFDAAGHKRGAVAMISDISLLKRAEQQIRVTGELLAQKSRVLELTLDSLSQGVVTIDTQGRVNAYNRRFWTCWRFPNR